jgi:hypothetical protein
MKDINIYDIYKPCISANEEGYARFLKREKEKKWKGRDDKLGSVPPCLDSIGAYDYLRNKTV